MSETNTDKNDKKDNNVSKKDVDEVEKKNEEKKAQAIDYVKVFTGFFSDGISSFFNYKKSKDAIDYELEKAKIEKETNRINKDILELKEKLKIKEEEEIKKKKQSIQNEEEWKKDKNKLIDSILSQINYIDIIKDTFSKSSEDFNKDINEKIATKIFNNDFKDSFSGSIRKMHTSILDSIKNNIPEIETLNFMIAGMSGAGKSSLTNAILKDDNLSKIGDKIHPETDVFKQYSNPTIYDTFGVEPSNVDRNILKTKEKIQETFDENLTDPKKSLHGILYCIKNCDGDVRILKEEIKFIQEISKTYEGYDILTIVLTQTPEPEQAEERKKELHEALDNENIEIIPILVKDRPIKFKGKIIETYPKYGLDTLINTLKKNAKKRVSAYFREVAKIKLKEKYFENINIKYNEIKKELEKNEFEISLSKQCENILEKLFDSLNLDYEDLEKVLLDYKEKLNAKIMECLKKENKDQSMKKINEKYLDNNEKCEHQLTYDSSFEEYNFMTKLENYFDDKIDEEVNKILLEKSSLRFLEKSREYFGDIISENLKDEEIEDIVNSNLDKILKKIDNE